MVKRVGIVGWRGMVGSVLLERMRSEADFSEIETIFLSTSQAGGLGPDLGEGASPLLDANQVESFSGLDAVISCQGGDYTQAIHGPLRASGWNGLWIDAASSLRMSDTAAIVLDPVNGSNIRSALREGIRDFIGGNCTVSLMLMAISSLFEQGWVEWVNVATYQAASGAGAKSMRELVDQMRFLGEAGRAALEDPAAGILKLDRAIQAGLGNPDFPSTHFGAPLAASLIPWIDRAMANGQTREEWKGQAETNKILGSERTIPVDGVCVRVGAMRSHSQALTIKLTSDVPLDEIEDVLRGGNDWVELVPNEKQATLEKLSPAAVSGTLRVPVGRVRKLTLGPQFLSAFTVGDQLLWGAAEPLRRMLKIAIHES